jgi:ribosomal protein S18 acetylase RimI-like enzyme
MQVSLRKVTLETLPELQVISKTTFQETFANLNTEENMIRYLNEGFGTKKLEQEVLNENSIFYIAEVSDSIIGYLKVNFKDAQTENVIPDAMEIERIYVASSYYGEGVGQLLFEKALQLARVNDVNCVWLGVWEHNPRAIRFYEKNGFTRFDKHIFKLGDEEQTDILMKRILD